MADSGNPEDLVSQVSVTGTEEAAAKLDAYAASGSKAFEKINASAQLATRGVQAAGTGIEQAGKQGAAGFNELGNAANKTRDVPGKIKDIENAISNLTSKFPQLTQAVGRFSQRMALVGAAVVAAGVGLAASAAKVAKAVDGQSDSQQKATDRLIDANNASLQAEISQINYASSVRKLNADLQSGKITSTQYSAQLRQLQADQKEQTRVANEVANAQARVKEENDRLTKSLKDRTAYQGLIDTFGGPLLTSLSSFGRQVEVIRQQILASFGPSLAGIIDTISATLTRNASAIGKFFADASARLNALLKTNGPQIQILLENIGAAASSVFIGIINAAPGIIDFFNNALVPAIKKIATAFNAVADAINFVFGTKLTGGSIVLIAIIAQMTGSIRLLFTLVRAGSGIFKGFISVIETVGIAILEAFGFKSVQGVAKLGAAVAKGGGPVKTFLALIRTAIPLVTALGTALATALGIGLAPALLIIAAVTAALVFLLTKVDWKTFGADAQAAIGQIITFFGNLLTGAKNIALGIVAAFVAVNDFFNQMGTNLGQVFSSAWSAIVSAATAAAGLFTSAWNTVSQFFSTLATSIGTFFSGVWTGIVTAATTAGTALTTAWQAIATAVQTAWQAVVTFFQGVPATLQLVWDTIKQAIIDAFNSAVNAVTNAFQALLAKAKQFLQPILDLLNAIAALTSAAGGSGGAATGGAGGFARGGEVAGPGGPTADKIPAWLSDGEFVIRARSAAKYGVGLLHAINSGRFQMPKFAMGGLVSAMPRVGYASGGDVSPAALRPVALSIAGETFNMMAPEDVGSRLTKFAVERQNKSAGRKPAWVGRGRN